jgi:hypothetical protein
VLPLTGLGVGEVTQLVAEVVGDQRAAGVHRRTGGNPFLVQQVSWLLRSGQDGIPPGVHEASLGCAHIRSLWWLLIPEDLPG